MWVDGIIVNKQDACGLTPAVSKVSSGALEVMPIFSVKFVKPFLEEVQSKYSFKVISTNIDEEENDGEQVESIKRNIIPLNKLRVGKDDNVLLILGSEGEGVS